MSALRRAAIIMAVEDTTAVVLSAVADDAADRQLLVAAGAALADAAARLLQALRAGAVDSWRRVASFLRLSAAVLEAQSLLLQRLQSLIAYRLCVLQAAAKKQVGHYCPLAPAPLVSPHPLLFFVSRGARLIRTPAACCAPSLLHYLPQNVCASALQHDDAA